jgi:hydrogenase/urease accessory protein HupE
MTVRQRLGELEVSFTRGEFARYLVVFLTLLVVQAVVYRPIIDVLIRTTPHGAGVWEPLFSVYAFLFAVAVGLWSVMENEHE